MDENRIINENSEVGRLTVKQFRLLWEQLNASKQNPTTIVQLGKQKLLNVEEAAELLGYSVATIYSKTHLRLIPFLKKGRKLWFKESDLLEWAETGRKRTVEEMSKNLTALRKSK